MNQLLRVRRRWYVVVAVTLVTLVGAFVAGIGDRTTYSAKAALSASSPTSENSPYALALAYIYLFNDASFQDALVRKAKVPSGVTSVAEPATVGSIFYIDATASSPEAARSAASALASTFRTEINGALEDAKRQTINSVEAPFEQRYAQRLDVPGDERAGLQDQINTINANTNGMINSVGLDSAVTASSPQRTTTLLTALGGGLVVGLLVALGVDIASRRVRTGFDVTDKTAFTTALTVADPDDAGGSARTADLRHLANRLVSGSETRPQVIAVIAAQSGASAAARQLAGSMASALGTSEVPSLLVRTDTRRPVGPSARPGFVDVLVDPDRDLHELTTAAVDGVCVMEPGNRVLDPIGVVTRSRVAKFLDAARKHAEVVVIESPIVLESPEAQIICAQTDVVVTVVDPLTATVAEVSETYRLLAEVKAPIGPVVVMAAPPVAAPPLPASPVKALLTTVEQDEPPAVEASEAVEAETVGAIEAASPAAPGAAPVELEAADVDMSEPEPWETESVQPVTATVGTADSDSQSADDDEVVDDADVVPETDQDAPAEEIPASAEVVATSVPAVRPMAARTEVTPARRPLEKRLGRALQKANRLRLGEMAAARRTPLARPVVAPRVSAPVPPPVDEESEEFLPYRPLRSPVIKNEHPAAPEPEVEVEVEPTDVVEPEVVEPEVEPEPEAVVEPEPEAEPEAVAEPEVEVEPEPEPEPEADVVEEPDVIEEVVVITEPGADTTGPDTTGLDAGVVESGAPTDQFAAMPATPTPAQGDPFAFERHAAAQRAAHDEFLREQALRERWEAEQRARQQWVRDQEARERRDRERRAQEELARRQAVQERLARQQWAREQAAREEADRKERERLERERVDRLERERIARERAERQQLERIERARAAHLERERVARAEAARRRLAQEQRERDERAAVERAVAERLKAERLAAERLEEERREIERRLEVERQAREQLERELALQQQVAREQFAQEQWAQYRLAQERWLEDQWARYRVEQQRWLQQRAAGVDVPPPVPPSPNAVPPNVVSQNAVSQNVTSPHAVSGGRVVEGSVERRDTTR
ncbi:SMC family protein [Williamsia deligens]|uniref:Capsular polysaccharide biosynthesis protein n=1 Tax=Williamsia deligens TaxID=321325 RepID=A0ABW3G7Q4_9NOCA|nr:hypothetical protein [Williamsia deligens]MCP2194173.1 hypothetical protein [Williamsia deligens]